MAGEDSFFRVTLRDINNNPTRNSDGQVVNIAGKKGINCEDIGLGVFECRYNFEKANTYSIQVKVNGKNVLVVAPYTFEIEIRPRKIDPSSGRSYAFSHTQIYAEVRKSTENLVVFSARDEYGNPAKQDRSIEMVCDSQGPRSIEAYTMVRMDCDQSEEFTGMYTMNMQVEETIGYYNLNCYVVKQGGLNGRYYNNLWLQGEPAAKTIDASINFNWGIGLVTGDASDMVSANWDGYLKPPQEGNLYKNSSRFKKGRSRDSRPPHSFYQLP